MTRPLLLDLFCGAGGAAMGYHRAGFDVVGVDINPQPHYPFESYRADAMQVLEFLAADAEPWPGAPGFDVIHASPPCQDHSTLRVLQDREHGTGWFLAVTRYKLRELGLPYVVENVGNAGKSMRTTLTLHGGMFGLGVHRLRRFECSELILAPRSPYTHEPIDVTGTGGRSPRPPGQRGGIHRKPRSVAEAQQAMGIDWMTRAELNQAIPPAYTEHIGRQLLNYLGETNVPRPVTV